MKNSKELQKLVETLQSLFTLVTLLLSSTPILYPIGNELRRDIFSFLIVHPL